MIASILKVLFPQRQGPFSREYVDMGAEMKQPCREERTSFGS